MVGAHYQSPKRPRSVAWSYFEKGPNNEKNVYCILCGSKCQGFSTSTMFNHLRFKHPETFKEAKAQRDANKKMYDQLKTEKRNYMNTIEPGVKKRGPKPKNKSIEASPFLGKQEFTSVCKTGLAVSTFTPKKLSDNDDANRALLKMLAVDLVPGSIVKGTGFKELLKALDCRYVLPDKKSLMGTMLPHLAEETKNRIKQEVANTTFLTLTVDSWTYCSTQNFITVTAHFVKDSWRLSSVVLDSFDCTDENTASDIAAGLKGITDEWGITERINAFISDSKDNNVITATMSTGWEHLSCFGHLLNQIMLNAMGSVGEFVRIQKKISETVEFFEKTLRASEALTAMQIQHNLPVHKLKQDVPTRWNATYNMLERILEQYEPVNTILCSYGKDGMCIFDDEVEVIRGLLQVLLPFDAATKELCTEPYTPMSKVIPIANLLQQVTAAVKALESEPQAQLKNALLQQMELHFTNLEFIRSMAVATLLDPRFKKHGFTNATALENAEQHLMSEVISNLSTSETFTSSLVAGNDVKTSSFWGLFDQKVSEAGANKTASSEADNESRRYFKEANTDRSSNPLLWWKLNEIQYPNLKVLAQKYLCIPATAIVSQKIFTKQAEEEVQKRDLLSPKNLLQTIFLNKNLI